MEFCIRFHFPFVFPSPHFTKSHWGAFLPTSCQVCVVCFCEKPNSCPEGEKRKGSVFDGDRCDQVECKEAYTTGTRLRESTS